MSGICFQHQYHEPLCALCAIPTGASNMGRFDYVRYDDEAQRIQAALKTEFEMLERSISSYLPDGRAKSLTMTKLEEAYMWVGKAIRDEQVAKRGAELQEQRKDG